VWATAADWHALEEEDADADANGAAAVAAADAEWPGATGSHGCRCGS